MFSEVMGVSKETVLGRGSVGNLSRRFDACVTKETRELIQFRETLIGFHANRIQWEGMKISL